MVRSIKPLILVFVLMIFVSSWGRVYLSAQPAHNSQKNNQAGKFLDFDGNGREDLINIREVAGMMTADGLSLSGNSWSLVSLAASQDEMIPVMKWFHGDFNGDGKSDIAKIWDDQGYISCDVHISGGTSFTAQKWLVRNGEFSFSCRFLTGDFDGDNLTDVAKIFKSNNQICIDILRSTGSDFVPARWITGPVVWNNTYFFLPGDFTGDGSTDIARFNGSTFDLFASNPAAQIFSYRTLGTTSVPYDKSHRLVTGDFNGDKKLDITKISVSSNNKANIDLFLSEDGSMKGLTAATELGENRYGMKWFPGDFNGDGKTDLVKIYNESGGLKIDVYSSSSATFTTGTWFEAADSLKDTQRWFAGDYNGDGRTDLSVLSLENGTQYLHWYEAAIDRIFIAHKQALEYPNQVDRILGNRIYTHKYVDPSWIQGPIPEDLQKVKGALESGQDVWLARGETYFRNNDSDKLIMSADQQMFGTFDPIFYTDFATIVMKDMPPGNCITTRTVTNTLIENFICDGNRYGFDLATDGKPDSYVSSTHLIAGGVTSGQRIKRVIVLNSRGQSAFKIQEGTNSVDNWIENCIVFGAGVDARGSGRDLYYKKGWADAIGSAGVRSQIRDNLVIDGTDVGIVLFTTPANMVEKNVIVSLSRETLGGINLVDFLPIYKTSEDGTYSYFNYNVNVRNNYIDAFGARMHNGIPTGDGVWSPNVNPTRYGVGQMITGNIMTGDCFGYGIAVRTGRNMIITGNISNAIHTGVANGFNNSDPDPATDFIAEKKRLINCILQPDFKDSKLYLSHLLYMNHEPTRPVGHPDEGYKFWLYTPDEANGIVKAAFTEMLQRLPDAEEIADYSGDLITYQYTADEVRRRLMRTEEFISRFGSFDDNELHTYRTDLWMSLLKMLDNEYIKEHGNFPPALFLYNMAISELSGSDELRFSQPLTAIHDYRKQIKSDVICYPNPFSDTLTIKSDEYIGSVIISCIDGRMINNINVEDNSVILNMGHLENGIYIISIFGRNGLTYHGKVIKT